MARIMSEPRRLAKETGRTFFIGPPCKFGHDGERYVSTGACRVCISTQARPDRVRPRPKQTNEFEQLLQGN